MHIADINQQCKYCLFPEMKGLKKYVDRKIDIKNKRYHSPTRNPIEAIKATMPTMVEKWQALESMFMTHTSCPVFCIKNHPEEEMQPKTIMAKN